MSDFELVRRLEARGYRAAIVSIERLQDLQKDIESLLRRALIDETFYQKHLSGFLFDVPEALPGAQSLVIVAVKDPQVCFTFTWRGRQFSVRVPPTYLHWERTDGLIANTLREMLEAQGYVVASATVPKKLLAARSGLAAYGRNNVTHVPGMGSSCRLAAFFTDLPSESENWQEPRMMERCQTCTACLRSCPSGAISGERFLLYADRCITLHNEEAGDVPFPTWLEPSWHNCLVGCLRCQEVCPENKSSLVWAEMGAELSSEETSLLLSGRVDLLPVGLVSKLERWDLMDLLDVLPRNLRAILEREEEI